MSDLAKTNKSILIMRGPSQFPFLKKVFVNDETIVMTLFIDKKEVKVEIAVQFCSSNIESPLTIIGYIKNSATANKVKDFLQIDKDYTHDSNEWNVYFSALYDIKEGKGELFPFLLNSTTTEIYHSGVDFDPADHPYNDDITIAWPNPLKIILEHHKAFAIKRAVAEALANAKKPESRPNDESVCNRVSALKIIIANCDQGDELEKKLFFNF